MGRKSKLKQHHEPAQAPTAPGEFPAPVRNAAPVVAAVLAVLVLFIYAQVRNHSFVNYDDDLYVFNNPHVTKGLTGEGISWAFRSIEANWHPVTWMSHMLDVELFGVSAPAHAFVSVLLHLINSILVFLLFQRLTGHAVRSGIVAALFAVHPLHVESVAWISERKDVLSALFMLLTLHAYVQFARSRKPVHYVLALIAFALGLMSKGMLVTLPFVLLLLDYWPLQRFELTDFRTLGRHFGEKLPFFVVLVPSIVVTYLAQETGGAIMAGQPLPARLANAIVSYGAYLGKTVWPTGLGIPYPWRNAIEPWQVALALVILVAISISAFTIGRTRKALFTGWFWFAGMLVPVIGIVQIGSQSMADRYTYLPHIGLFAAIVWLVADAIPRALRRGMAIFAGIIVLALAVTARAQTSHWKNSVALFSHSVAVTRNNSIAHTNLGNALQEAGDPAGALEQLALAAQADPTDANVLVKLARLEIQAGRNDAAAQHLQQAAQIRSTPEIQALLATAKGDAGGSVDTYAAAVAATPNDAGIRNDYAAALASAGRDAEALEQYRHALKLNPGLYDAHMNMGALLSRMERNDEARAAYTAAAAARPSTPEPYVYLSLLNASMGNFAGARTDIERARAIDAAEANRVYSNARRMPLNDANLNEYLGFLQTQR